MSRLSSETSRRISVLQALERGDYDSLPSPRTPVASTLRESGSTPHRIATPLRQPPCKAHSVYACVVCNGEVSVATGRAGQPSNLPSARLFSLPSPPPLSAAPPPQRGISLGVSQRAHASLREPEPEPEPEPRRSNAVSFAAADETMALHTQEAATLRAELEQLHRDASSSVAKGDGRASSTSSEQLQIKELQAQLAAKADALGDLAREHHATEEAAQLRTEIEILALKQQQRSELQHRDEQAEQREQRRIMALQSQLTATNEALAELARERGTGEEAAQLRTEIEILKLNQQQKSELQRRDEQLRQIEHVEQHRIHALQAQEQQQHELPQREQTTSHASLLALRTELQAAQEQQAGRTTAAAPIQLGVTPAHQGMQERKLFEAELRAVQLVEENARVRAEVEMERTWAKEELDGMRKERAAELEAAALVAEGKVQVSERLARRQEVESLELAHQQALLASQARVTAAQEEAASATTAQTEALAKAAHTVSLAQAEVEKEREQLLKAMRAEKERSAEVIAEFRKRVAAAESERIDKQAAMQRLQTEAKEARLACQKAEAAAAHEGRCAAQEQALRQELQRKKSALHTTASQQQEALRRQLVSREDENTRLAKQMERVERRRQSEESQLMARLEAERRTVVETRTALAIAQDEAVKAADERAKVVAAATQKLQQSEAAFENDRRKRLGTTVPKEVAHQASLAAKYAQEAALEAERELVRERQRRQDAESAAQTFREAAMRMRMEETRSAARADEATTRLSSLEAQMSVALAHDERALNESQARARAEREARLVVERKAKAQLTQQAEELRQLMSIAEQEKSQRVAAEKQHADMASRIEALSPLETLGAQIFGDGAADGVALTREEFRLRLAASGVQLR